MLSRLTKVSKRVERSLKSRKQGTKENKEATKNNAEGKISKKFLLIQLFPFFTSSPRLWLYFYMPLCNAASSRRSVMFQSVRHIPCMAQSVCSKPWRGFLLMLAGCFLTLNLLFGNGLDISGQVRGQVRSQFRPISPVRGDRGWCWIETEYVWRDLCWERDRVCGNEGEKVRERARECARKKKRKSKKICENKSGSTREKEWGQ